ncbi:hypothetical protein Bbelb_341090 [Branchiostoma belcheri]|nr:hypothetical protein Bbelb_341090 [Branchiostoma belcheri]
MVPGTGEGNGREISRASFNGAKPNLSNKIRHTVASRRQSEVCSVQTQQNKQEKLETGMTSHQLLLHLQKRSRIYGNCRRQSAVASSRRGVGRGTGKRVGRGRGRLGGAWQPTPLLARAPQGARKNLVTDKMRSSMMAVTAITRYTAPGEPPQHKDLLMSGRKEEEVAFDFSRMRGESLEGPGIRGEAAISTPSTPAYSAASATRADPSDSPTLLSRLARFNH